MFSSLFQSSKKSSSKSSTRGSTLASRGTSKSSKRSYSAESLLSNEGMVMSMDPSSLEVDPTKSHHQFNKPADFSWNLGVDQVISLVMATTSNLVQYTYVALTISILTPVLQRILLTVFCKFQTNASGQLVFPSVSPSPGGNSFFGQDLGGLDFTNAIFGTAPESGSYTNTSVICYIEAVFNVVFKLFYNLNQV